MQKATDNISFNDIADSIINTKKFNQKAKRYDEYTRVKNSIKNDKNIRNIVQMFLYVDILFFSLKNKIVERLIISGGKNVGK